MRGEQGEDLGRTWGDLTREIGDAITTLDRSKTIKRLDGENFKVYRVTDKLIRVDIDTSEFDEGI